MVISPGIVTIFSNDTEVRVKAVPFGVTAARLVGKVSTECVKALKKTVLIVELVGDVPAESVGALPVWVKTVRLNGNVPAESETSYGLDVLAYAIAVRVNDDERRIIISDPPPPKRCRIDNTYPNNFTNYTSSYFTSANSDSVSGQTIPPSFFDEQSWRPPYKPYKPFYPK
jgi:hypothetical protein